MRYTTQPQVRMAFWEQTEGLSYVQEMAWKRKARDKDFRTDVRVAFCDFVEDLSRNGYISEALASRANLQGRII